jgi:hypothetical protein
MTRLQGRIWEGDSHVRSWRKGIPFRRSGWRRRLWLECGKWARRLGMRPGDTERTHRGDISLLIWELHVEWSEPGSGRQLGGCGCPGRERAAARVRPVKMGTRDWT